MAYFYVKDDGTAESGTATGDGGRYTTQKTGDWSTAFSATTEYYASLGAAAAATTPPADGDYILVSDLHNKTYDNTTNVLLNSADIKGGAGLFVISVDDTAVDEYKQGASENLSDGNDDFWLHGTCSVYGLSLETGDDVFYQNSTNSTTNVVDCTLTVDGANDNAFRPGPGGDWRLVNVDVNVNTEGILFTTLGGIYVDWYGGTVTGATTIMGQIAINSSYNINIYGVDLSSITVLYPTDGLVSDYPQSIKLSNCKLHASPTMPSSELKRPGHRFEMYNCDDGTSDIYHRFYVADGAGVASNNDSTYVTATESWYEGSDNSSIEVQTTALCSKHYPFVFELPAQYVDLANTGNSVITVNLVTDLTLTDTDIAAFLCYPDAVTAVQPNWVTSSASTVGAGNYGIDPLAAGNALPSSTLGSNDWTNPPASPNYYRMDLDTAGDPGQATAVSIRIEVYKPSITAGQLFINTEVSTS